MTLALDGDAGAVYLLDEHLLLHYLTSASNRLNLLVARGFAGKELLLTLNPRIDFTSVR